jgi:hypothetical protein
MIGVDEDTALIGTLGGEWQVMGRSRVHIYTRGGVKEYESGQTLVLD